MFLSITEISYQQFMIGGRIKGNKLDAWFSDHNVALIDWGRMDTDDPQNAYYGNKVCYGGLHKVGCTVVGCPL